MDRQQSLEEMARTLVESGEYRVARRFVPCSEYHPPDDGPKLIGAVVDVETTGISPERDRIIELGVCLFEFSRDGRIYRVIGSYEWFEDPGVPIPLEIAKLTGITDEMVAGRRIDENAVGDLLSSVSLVLAHNAGFDRPFLERRLPAFAAKPWACTRSDIDWRAENIRSEKLEYLAYALGFFHAGHRASADCLATLHLLAQPLPATGRLALDALLERARALNWRLWARDSHFDRREVLKARGYSWCPGEFGRPKCWFRDVSDAERIAETVWLRDHVLGQQQPVWTLHITARKRYSDRCWDWGQPVIEAAE